MRSTRITLLCWSVAVALFAAACAPAAPPAQAPAAAPAHDAAMDMHHLHGLMAHGFEMALEGASLKMLGDMKMAGAVDTTAVSHGDAMMTEGKALIDKAINGPAMGAMHMANASDPVMLYTHDLAKAMNAVIDQFQQMPAPEPKDTKAMAMHHMHIALIHAALMASQGASLKMTAAMKMSDAVDQEASTHAAAMLTHARALYEETMNGDAMKQVHATAAGDAMAATHAMGDTVSTVIDALSKMP
ncbi:MAG: hypothetical protein U0Q11_11190 [Vicinamibacterales bacterium]